MKKFVLMMALAFCLPLCSCDDSVTQSADQVMQSKTEQSMTEETKELGMPAITKFTEKRDLKTIYELRDKGIVTQAYLFNELKGCLVYLGVAIGYGIPYGTQYSNPTKYTYVQGTYPDGTNSVGGWTFEQMPQAEPNGLYMPPEAEGTWLLIQNPNNPQDIEPMYAEPRVLVVPFRMTAQECH